MIKEWNAVSLSLSTSFLTWNVKRIQDTLLPNGNAKKNDMWWFSPYRHLFTWNVKRIQDTLFPKWKWERVTKLLLDNIWTTRGKSEYEERWGGIMSSPHWGVCSPLLCVTDTLPGTSTSNMRYEDADGRSKAPTLPPSFKCISWYSTSPTDAKVFA